MLLHGDRSDVADSIAGRTVSPSPITTKNLSSLGFR